MRRRLIIMGTTLFIVFWLLWPSRFRDKINENSFNSIKLGMSPADVQAIIGIAPGIYSNINRDRMLFRREHAIKRPLNEGNKLMWVGDENVITIYMDDQGMVSGSILYTNSSPVEPFITSMRRWLKI